jgi:hypothetical protein
VRLAGVVASVILGCALMGCGAAAPQRADAVPATSASIAASPVSPVADVLVSFRRQGGIAGFDDRLTVRPSGSYEISRRGGTPTTGQLSADELATLRQAMDASGFTRLPAVNPGPVIADGFTYVVGYAGHEVVAEDGGVPAALTPVLTMLNDIVSR